MARMLMSESGNDRRNDCVRICLHKPIRLTRSHVETSLATRITDCFPVNFVLRGEEYCTYQL